MCEVENESMAKGSKTTTYQRVLGWEE